MTIKNLIEQKRSILPPKVFEDFMTRNIKRLERNLREYNSQLIDIEEGSREASLEDYEAIYALYRETSHNLEVFRGLK